MTKLMSRAIFGASAIALGVLAASPAAAQNIDRIVTFGDSYPDDGNAFQLGYANPSALAIYPTGRFSGGTNYIDTLADLLGAPVENFAIGGAFGGSNNGTLCFDPFYAPGTSPLCGKGLQFEIDNFLNVGAQSGVFPNGTPSFDEGDLVTVSIGGNDARIYQQFGLPLSGAAAAGTAAAAATSIQLDRLVAAGAPTISFLAGDTGRLPEITAFPALAQIRSTFSTAFNGSMQTTLAGYAADGVMVHYLDLNLMLDRVAADPGAYGITNGLVCPLFTSANFTCLLNSSGYLFYGDALHLTTGGFAIVARYVAAQLTAPLTLQAPSDIALDTAHQFGRTLSGRMNFARFGDADLGLKAFVIGDMFSRSVNARARNDEFKITGHGGTAGVEYGFGGGVIGLAANLSRPKAEFGNNASRDKGRSMQFGGYAAMGFGGGFAQGYGGFGEDDHNIRRRGVIDSMDGDADGRHWIAGAKLGYLMPFGGISIGPVAAIDYAKAKVGDYTETGDAALTLNVSSISVSSLRGSIGGELRGDLDSGGLALRPYGALVLEKELSDGDRSVSFSQTSAPGIVNSWDFDDISKKAYGRFTSGLSAGIIDNVSLDAALSFTFGKEQDDETSAHVGVKVGF